MTLGFEDHVVGESGWRLFRQPLSPTTTITKITAVILNESANWRRSEESYVHFYQFCFIIVIN
jgi:hypothetical protein